MSAERIAEIVRCWYCANGYPEDCNGYANETGPAVRCARYVEAVSNPVEEQMEDIKRRLAQAKRDALHRVGILAPKWDDVIFLIDQMEGWRRLADSWARECDRLRAAHDDGSLHPAACGPGCRSQHTDDHSRCEHFDGSADA